MPVEAKPLFRPDVLRPHLLSFQWPSNVTKSRTTLARWAEMLSTGRADKFKEQELLPDFLTDVFCDVLGYSRPADNAARFTISREKHVQIDGKFADAVLGNFRPNHEEFIIALEGKGPLDPLDRPFAGRKMSAVDQGYRYAINLPCDWIIVTSMRQTRLYFKGADQYTYERFDTERLASDESLLKRFLFLLGAERVAPETGRCHLFGLLTSSEKVGKELTKDFYFRYAEMRQNAFEQLCAENPGRSKDQLLSATQKLLDRILFCAFCEDRGLLPADTIQRAYEHRDPYQPKPIWDNFRGLFRAIDTGNAPLNIPAYNGGLFAHDPALDDLKLTDAVCDYFRELSAYDYRPASEISPEADECAGHLIDVDILGHIFEQSITDLERLRNELEGRIEPLARDKLTSRRKKEGAFYTPAFITRYIVEQALGSVLKDRFEKLRQIHEAKAKATERAALADPTVYNLEKLKKPHRDALVKFWEAWQDELGHVRILDPACGSGAFLIEAFDQLHMVYEISNDRLKELRGSRSLFDPDRQILQHNLFGVDLNEEAIEICRLSLWIKTAARGKVLTSLDHTIRVGNSVVSDTAVHPRALEWQDAFPEVFANGGFDVVVGNPPYVRQEWITPIKPYLQANYRAFHGMADLYVYFYELGCRVLKPGGRLSFVVTNKWMKAGYGEPLRRFFAEDAWTESVIDFGHAKQIFEDADVFPSIIVLRKPTDEPKPQTLRVCAIPRETLRVDDLSQQIAEEGFEVASTQLGADTWQLEPRGVNDILAKIRERGIALNTFTGVSLRRGIVTGFNEAVCIDGATKDRLVSEDPKCAELLRSYVRGQDVDRWKTIWAETWMIFARKGVDIDSYPSVKAYLQQFRDRLEPKPKGWEGDWNGRAGGNYQWYELQTPVEYWREFEKPKLIYQEIQFHPCYSFDTTGQLATNKVFIIPAGDLYLLSVLNSPLMWWHNWRYLPHMKDEALSPAGFLMESLPIAEPTVTIRKEVEVRAEQMIEITGIQQTTRQTLLDWLKVEYGIDKPSMKLQNPLSLDSDSLVTEVKKIRGKSKPLTAAALKALRDEDTQILVPARALAQKALLLERQLSDLVNSAYGLTPAEVQLMWDTAPPRMPIAPPA